MAKHRTKAETCGLLASTRRAAKRQPKLSAAERKKRAAERAEEKSLWKRRSQVLRAMPFVNDDRPEERDYWDVKETGDLALDQMLGEQLATQFLRFGKEEGDELGGSFIAVIEAMIDKGPDYCVQVRMGFLHRLKHLIPAGYRFDDDGEIVLLVR